MVLVLVYYPNAKWGEAVKGEMTRKLGVARQPRKAKGKNAGQKASLCSLESSAVGCCLVPDLVYSWSCTRALALLAVEGGWGLDLSVFQKEREREGSVLKRMYF